MNTGQITRIAWALSVALMIVCGASCSAESDFAYRINLLACLALPFVAPVAFAALGVSLIAPPLNNPATSQSVKFALGADAAVTYVLAFAVVSRATEISWQHVKFGESSLSLGFGTALLYTPISLVLGALTYSLHRHTQANSFASLAGRSALGMLIGASLVYLALIFSPFVSWRA